MAEKKDETKAPSLEKLQSELTGLKAQFRMLLKVCERHFGTDIDRDGKIGGSTVRVMLMVFVLGLFASFALGRNLVNYPDNTGTNVFYVATDDDGTADLTVAGDLTVGGSVTASGSQTVAGIDTTGDITLASDEYIDNDTAKTVKVVCNDTVTGASNLVTFSIQTANATNNMDDGCYGVLELLYGNDDGESTVVVAQAYADIVTTASDTGFGSEDATVAVRAITAGTMTTAGTFSGTGLALGSGLSATTYNLTATGRVDVTGAVTGASFSCASGNIVCSNITISATTTVDGLVDEENGDAFVIGPSTAEQRIEGGAAVTNQVITFANVFGGTPSVVITPTVIMAGTNYNVSSVNTTNFTIVSGDGAATFNWIAIGAK